MLTWLHLSDWHQRGTEFDRKLVRDALMKDIGQRHQIDPTLEKIDFIIFSGDLAFSGKTDEYETAQKYFLAPLLEATDLKVERLFCVPGNHDLNRDDMELVPKDLHTSLSSEELVKKWLDVEKKRRAAFQVFEQYREFISNYTGQQTPDYASIQKLHIDNKDLALAGLNSAWMCARHKDADGQYSDYGHTVVGEPQVYSAMQRLGDADLRIVVLHHPFDWLTEFDRFRTRAALRRHCNFILSGHEHCPEVEILRGTHGNSIIIPAGASYDRRVAEHPRYTNAYNFVQVDLDNKSGTVYLRRWNDTNGEWRPDTDTYAGGKFVFSF